MRLWLHIDQLICRSKGCLIMPVWLDAIPEKAPKIVRPDTRRWLLFLAFIMLGDSAHIMVLDVRTNRICLLVHRSGASILHVGLIFGLRRFAYKAGQVGLSPEMSSGKRLLTVKFCVVSAAPGSSVLIFRARPETKPMTCLRQWKSRRLLSISRTQEDVTNRSDTRHYQNIRQI